MHSDGGRELAPMRRAGGRVARHARGEARIHRSLDRMEPGRRFLVFPPSDSATQLPKLYNCLYSLRHSRRLSGRVNGASIPTIRHPGLELLALVLVIVEVAVVGIALAAFIFGLLVRQ